MIEWCFDCKRGFFSVCCNWVLYAVCLGFYGRYACFVRSLAGFSIPILEGVETKNGSYWKSKDFADILMKK